MRAYRVIAQIQSYELTQHKLVLCVLCDAASVGDQ